MAVELTAYVPLLALAAVTTLGLAAYSWRHRAAPGATALAGLSLGMAAWAGFYALGLVSQSVPRRLLWLRLNWLGSGFVPAFWLLFALEYSGRTEWIDRRTVAALVSVPVATVVLAWTTPWHDLMWSNVRIRDVGRVTMLRYDAGLWYTVFDVYTYLVILLATVVLVSLVLRHRDLYTDQAVALLVGSLVPAVGYLTTVLELVREGVDPTPLTFPVTALLFGYVIFRGNLFDALTTTAAVGQESAVAAMADGVVVVDDDGEIIETNPSARTLLDTDESLVGRSVADVSTLSTVPLDGSEHTVETTTADRRVLEVYQTPIEDPHDRVIGHSLVVRDVTERVRSRERLAVSNRVLRHNLRNRINVVRGHAEHVADRTTDETVARSAASIQSAADSLARSGEKIRAAVEAVGDTAEPVVVDFAAVAREAAAEHTAVTVDAPDRAAALAVPDVDAAVRELVTNALEHAGPDPDVSATVALADDTVRLVVRDDGPGIPDHERRVVEEGREDALEHGSGAGLWLVRWLVVASGGSLSIDGDDGTVVTLSFDRVREE
ncbi:histidine kinase N-terminal 7TM domain-containing protein [Halobaculum sp. MBLA0147]|uniref:histidine kinase N-terminal 7TM domain-containing protein n=1 Tax=Halobaculum sp. MBLA0147 TaxID=3079934 RepID=UPI0035263669